MAIEISTSSLSRYWREIDKIGESFVEKSSVTRSNGMELLGLGIVRKKNTVSKAITTWRNLI